MTAGVSMYRSILRRLAKLERAGEAELSFRTPVSHAVDVARRAEVTQATTSNHHVDALRATLPWLEGQEDGGGRGTFSVSRMRAIARDMFKNSAEEGSASKALDAYIVLIQQSRLQVCSTTVFHEPTSTRFEAWSSPIEDPFGGTGADKEHHHFAYRVRITNEGKKTVQILGRNLSAENASGESELSIPGYHPIYHGTPRLPLTPVISPGHVFDFASNTAISSPTGYCRISFAVEATGKEEGGRQQRQRQPEATEAGRRPKAFDDVKNMVTAMSAEMKSNPEVLEKVNEIMAGVPKEDLAAMVKMMGLPEGAGVTPDMMPDLIKSAAETMARMDAQEVEELTEAALENEERLADLVNLAEILPQTMKALRHEQMDVATLPDSHSECSTSGIRVKVKSRFLPNRSSPAVGQFFFTYDVSISNESEDKVVQVRDRHWIIRDSDGNANEVKGEGVVGEQPILRPGESFNYR